MQDTFEAAARAWAMLRGQPDIQARYQLTHLHAARRKLIAGLEPYYPADQQSGEGTGS